MLDYLESHQITGSLLIKIDTEGLDALIVDSLRPRWEKDIVSFVIEFNPLHFSPYERGREFLRKLATDFVLYDIYYCPNPSRFRQIDETGLDEFYDGVCKTRPHFYTDILLIPKRLPGLEEVIARLNKLNAVAGHYFLVSPSV